MNKPTNAILSIMILAILIIPVVSLDYVEDNTIDEILRTGGDNYEFYPLAPAEIDKDLLEDHHNSNTILSPDLDPALIVGIDYTSPSIQNLQYMDNLTYSGNNTYTLNMECLDYDDYVRIPLNITAHNLTKYDIFKVTSTETPELVVYTGSGQNVWDIIRYEIQEDEWLFVVQVTEKITVLTYPDEPVYFEFYDPDFSGDQATISIYYGEYVNETSLTLSDMTQYYIILTSTGALSIFTIIFMSDTIDIMFDRRRKGGR